MRNFTAGEERNTEHRGTAVGGQTRPRPFMLNKKLFGNYQTGFSLTVTHISSRSSPPPLFEAVSLPPTPLSLLMHSIIRSAEKDTARHSADVLKCADSFETTVLKVGFGPLFRQRVESLF